MSDIYQLSLRYLSIQF